MKVLDEKGKLFGKINLIDLLVILVLVAVVAAVVWKMGGDRISEALDTRPTIRYEVLCINLDPDACDFALENVGGQLQSNGELLDGHIVDCVVEPRTELLLDADGNAQVVEDPTQHNLRFTIEAKVSETGNAYGLGSQELRVGKSHIVKTMDVEYNGYITTMEKVDGNE